MSSVAVSSHQLDDGRGPGSTIVCVPLDVVVVEHMGPGMSRMLETMDIEVRLGATGDARLAVLAAPPSDPPGEHRNGRAPR